jgi:uracil-DNA glycosylase family 4
MPLKLPDGPYCGGCVLQKSGRGFMKVSGDGSSGVMLVGEALGYNEAVTGYPFEKDAPAGALLNRVLKRHVKVDRSAFHVANTVWWRPPGNNLQGTSYKYAAINHCAPNLEDAIAKYKPKAIVALGDIALKRLVPDAASITKSQSYAFESKYGWVVAGLHPSFIQRGAHKYQPILGHAINKALNIAANGYRHEVPHTIQQPNVSEVETWVKGYLAALAADPSTVLAFDIETNYKGARDESKIKEGDDPTYEILQISFAYNGHEGIAFEWDASFKPFVQRILGSHGQKIVWNRSYDVPRLVHHGIHFGGPVRDSMIAWHALQSDMDKGLGFVTPLVPANHHVPMWKHQSSEDGGWFYAAMDSVMLWRNDHYIMNTLREQGIYPFFHKYVEEVRPVLDDMEDAGVLVDTEAQAAFTAKLEGEIAALEAKMNEIVPEELKDNDPPEGYKRDPQDTTGMRQIVIKNQVWKECEICGLKNPTKPHFKEYVAKRSLHKNTICSGAGPVEVKGDERRWAKVKPFKPSPKQLLRYAEWKKYSLRKNYKTDNFTMDEETLTKLLKKHPNDPLFPSVLKHRSVQKLYGLYGPEGLLIGDDQRVHTHFSDNPSTFRFASYGPNMQNIPRPDPENPTSNVNLIRNLFIAGPGCLLGARDFSGIEAVVVGYLAGDRNYTRLAKMGVHDYFNAHLAVERGVLLVSDLPDLEGDDESLAAHLAHLKKELKATRPIAKMGVHMSNYIGSPLRMYQAAPDMFNRVADAEHVQGLYFDIFPKIKEWQTQTCRLTDRVGFIKSPYGLPQRFFQIYQFKRDEETQQWIKVLGEDAKRAVAANPQHIAAAIMRRSIYDLRDSWVRQYLRLTIHDELMWECLEKKMDLVDNTVKEVMERPNKELPLDPTWGMGEYLSVGTEAKFGKRWGEMK